jgi:alanine racemase
MVRTGMVLYGVYPALPFREAGRLDLRPAVALRARVAYVKQLAAGTSAGYERAYVAKEERSQAAPASQGSPWGVAPQRLVPTSTPARQES